MNANQQTPINPINDAEEAYNRITSDYDDTPELTPSTGDNSGNSSMVSEPKQEATNQQGRKRSANKRSTKNLPDFSVLDNMMVDFDFQRPN